MPSLGHLSWKRSVKFHNFPLLRVNVFFLFLSTIAPALVYVSTRAPVNSNLGCGYSCLCLLKTIAISGSTRVYLTFWGDYPH